MLETANIPSEKRLDYIDKNLNQNRSVRVKTCADVYGHWRAYKRAYKKAPKDGVEFQIDYIDTGLALDEETRPSAPIALALHGAPGSYHDFALLIHHLTQQKVRVIAPNFPEYIATVKTKVLFRHSADEKAAYLRDFLQAIQVNKIDLLISHSSAIFPTLLILLNANNEAIARQRHEQQLSSCHAAEDNVKCIPKKLSTRQKPFCGVSGNSTEKTAATTQTSKEQEFKCKLRNPDDTLEINEKDNVEENNQQQCEETFEDASDEVQLDSNNNNEKSVEQGAKSLKPDDDNQKQIQSGEKNASKLVEQVAKATKTIGEMTKRANNEEAPLDFNQMIDSQQIRKRKKNKKTDVIVKFEKPIEIKAVALLNPAGHRLPKSMKPTWFKCGSVHVYQHKFGRSLFRKFGPAFLTVVGVPVRVDNMDNVMLSATVMRNSKCHRVSKQLKQLSEMKIPTLLVFSENDKLIEKEIFYEMTQFMKLDARNFDIFNNDGNIELSQSLMEDWIRVMVFKAGGHYAYSNYAKTVNQAVSELLEKVRNRTSNNK